MILFTKPYRILTSQKTLKLIKYLKVNIEVSWHFENDH